MAVMLEAAMTEKCGRMERTMWRRAKDYSRKVAMSQVSDNGTTDSNSLVFDALRDMQLHP